MSKQQVDRAMFEKLLLDERSAKAAHTRAANAVKQAINDGVELVTRDNVTTNMTMGLGLRLPHYARRLRAALDAWHHGGDKRALDIVIDRLNYEAGLKRASKSSSRAALPMPLSVAFTRPSSCESHNCKGHEAGPLGTANDDPTLPSSSAAKTK